MLASVVGAFLDGLGGEREFDAPLLALLRAHGFREVHLLHGAYEFGKDAIAQTEVDGRPTQFTFQSKAGDLSLSGWRGISGQVDELRRNTLAHPGYDAALPRRGVLVLTGRLTGGAPVAVQNYISEAKGRGETPLDVWDRERLIELLTDCPECLVEAEAGPLLAMIGAADSGEVSDAKLEVFSRRWIAPGTVPSWRSVLEASLVAQRLDVAGRPDLASVTALCLVRAVWASAHGIEPPLSDALLQADLARDLFRVHASALLSGDREHLLEHGALFGGDGFLATYAVRCARLAEIAGLAHLVGDAPGREELSDWLSSFIANQPGCGHPISDRWAVSLVPPAVVLATTRPDSVDELLRGTISWICDAHEDGLGLAGPYADPREEVDYLLGSAFEHVQKEPRRASHLGALVLDLASALERAAVYEDARNDFEAVGLHPVVAVPDDSAGQYRLDAPLVVEGSPSYQDEWPAEGWRTAPHQHDRPERFYLGRIGRPWDQLAVSAVLRDRYWLWAIRALATPGVAHLDSHDAT